MYIHRALEPHIVELVQEYPVITLVGPRQSGKTTMAKHLFPSYTYVNLEDPQTRLFASEDLNGLFYQYGTHLIIDEVQHVPEVLSKIQVLVDEHAQESGQFILTGSQEMQSGGIVAQSLAGRTAIFTVLPLSLAELREAGEPILDRDSQLLRGFMPRVYQTQTSRVFDYYAGYVATYVQRDIKMVTAIQDELVFQKFLVLLSGRVGSLLNYTSLANDLGVSRQTVKRWTSLLTSSHIIHLLPPWFPSRTSSIVKTPKVYFHDTGVASMLLGIESKDQMMRDPLRGSLFENLIVMEALKQRVNMHRPPNLYFFRNSSGLEVDLLYQKQRMLIPYEIKSSEQFHKDQFASLEKFRKAYPSHLHETEQGGLMYAGHDSCTFSGYRVTPFELAGDLFG